MHTNGMPLGADGKPAPIMGAGPRGRLSRGQRKLLARGARYKKDKRKPILAREVFENGRMYETWVHPTKGKRKVRKHG